MTSYPADCRNIIVFPGLSPATLRRYERAGILAAVKLNSRLPDAALERLFAGSDHELTAAECLRLGLVDEVLHRARRRSEPRRRSLKSKATGKMEAVEQAKGKPN
jgi:enoyl-CoA hydratase/carnithine racemase